MQPDSEATRLEFLRANIRLEVQSHGCPCMCGLCEALAFEAMSARGEYSLIAGQIHKREHKRKRPTKSAS
jgi:hypothetical protein